MLTRSDAARPMAALIAFLLAVGTVTAQTEDSKPSSGWPIDPDAAPRPVSYSSNKARPISGTVEVLKGGYFDGSRSSIGGDVRFEANYHFAFELYAERNKFTVQNQPFTADVYGAHVKYAYNTSLFFGAYVQYNVSTDQLVTNLRVNFVHAPLSDLFVVYNERRDMAGGALQERYFTVKFTKLFQF